MSNIKCFGVEHDIRKCQFNTDYSSTCKNTVVLKCNPGEYVSVNKHNQQQVYYISINLFSTFPTHIGQKNVNLLNLAKKNLNVFKLFHVTLNNKLKIITFVPHVIVN